MGEVGCGKRSFLLYFKDGSEITTIPNLPEFNKITYDKTFNTRKEKISLIFTLNWASDEVLSFMPKLPKFDLVLVLIDLSSEKANTDLNFYREYVKIHFPKVQTLFIGTKQDKQLDTNVFDGLINSSAKTGKGFDQFEETLMLELELNHKIKKIP